MKFTLVGDTGIEMEQVVQLVLDKNLNFCERSSTLQFMKKGILWYILTDSTWNLITNTGKPTRSKAVNVVINTVKKLEVGQSGKAVCAKRAMSMNEFRFLLKLLEEKEDFETQYCTTTMLKTQYHLIA